MNTRVKKLKKEIEKNQLGALIIDRSQNTDEVSNQIDLPAKAFPKLEEENEGSELANEREEEIMPIEVEVGVQLPGREVERAKREERPRSQRR